MRTKQQKYQDLDQLIEEFAALQYPSDEERLTLTDAEQRRRGEVARGTAVRVVELLFDTGLANAIHRRASRSTASRPAKAIKRLHAEFAEAAAGGASSNDIAQLLDDFLVAQGLPTVLYA